MARKRPVWQRLVEEGFFTSRAEAERWILSGKVRAGGHPVLTAGQPIAADVPLSVKGIDEPYVSKGGKKLEGALAAFSIPVAGRVCIDAGASTGGFTDCLIKHGAARVYAVDVGYGQLNGSLRAHPSVVNLERTNIADASLDALLPPPSLGTIDLSYLSLRKAVPRFAELLRGQGDLICLVKPLFEIDDPVARRTGQIAPDAYGPLLLDLCGVLGADGYAVRGMTHSPVTGNNGTQEFFLWLSLGGGEALTGEACRAAVDAAVQAAGALPAYKRKKGAGSDAPIGATPANAVENERIVDNHE